MRLTPLLFAPWLCACIIDDTGPGTGATDTASAEGETAPHTETGDGDGEAGCVEPVIIVDECPAMNNLPVMPDPACCEPLPTVVPCMGQAGPPCVDSRRYTDDIGEHWACCDP